MKKLLPVIAGILVAAIAFFGYSKFLGGGEAETPAGAQKRAKAEAAVEKKKRLKAPIDGPTVQLAEPFTVNLADRGVPFYGRFAVALKVDAQTPVELAAHGSSDPPKIEELPEIRDAIIDVVSSKSSAELSSQKGWHHVKEEIKAAINGKAPHTVAIEVFITDRAIQQAA
jgi:flagellar basal body-associated protein FliL